MAQQRQMLVSGLLRASHDRLNELSAPPLAAPWLMHPSGAFLGPPPFAAGPGALSNGNSAMVRQGPGSLTNLASVGLPPTCSVLQPSQLVAPSAVIHFDCSIVSSPFASI